MGWNYRVMRHSSKNENTEEAEVWLGIHEVYYRDDDVDDLTVDVNETGYTVEPVRVTADDVDGLRWVLQKMSEALDKPVLNYDGSRKRSFEG